MWLTSHVQCCGFNVTQLQCVKTGEPSALWFYNHLWASFTSWLYSSVGGTWSSIWSSQKWFHCVMNSHSKKRDVKAKKKRENSLDVFGLQRSSWLYSSIGGTWWSMWLAKMDLLRLDFAFQKGNMKAKKKINILWTASETSASGDGCDW